MKKIFYFFLVCFILIGTAKAKDWQASNYLLATGNIEVDESVLDKNGDFIIIGTFKGTITSVSPNVDSYGGKDLFLAKYNKDMQLQWLVPIGSAGNDFASDIKIDENNNIVLSGAYKGTCQFGDGISLGPSGIYDVFLAKYSTSGTCLWSKEIATNSNIQVVRGFDIDENGNIILTGFYKNTADIKGQTITGRPNLFNNFYVQVDKDGDVANWVQNVTNNNTSSRIETSVYYRNAYYFTGNFTDSIYFDKTALKSANSGKIDMFLYKTDLQGKEEWLRRTYGADGNEAAGISTGDEYGNIYFTGYMTSTEVLMDSTASVVSKRKLATKGGFDMFILKYNPEGVLQWGRNYGDTGNDWGRDIDQRNGIVYVSGYNSGTVVYNERTIKTNSTADENGVVAFFDSEGNPIGAVGVKGSDNNEDAITTVSVDDQNNIFAAGYFLSDTIFVGDSAFKNPNAGSLKGVFVGRHKPYLLLTNTQLVNPSCNGDATGIITVTPYFGAPPYSYEWIKNGVVLGVNDSTITSRRAGIYKAIVTDKLGAKDTVTIELTQPDPFVITETKTDVKCYGGEDGTIDITVAGGNGGNIYQWEAISGSGQKLSTEDQDSLTVGEYKVIITDIKACKTNKTFVIGEASQIFFKGSKVTPVSAKGVNDGAIDLTVSGGTSPYVYEWDGTEDYDDKEDTTQLSGKIYFVKVKDNNQCRRDTSFFVPEPKLQVQIASTTNVGCKGASTGVIEANVLNSTGVTTFVWKDHATGQVIAGESTSTLSNRPVGVYRVVVKEGVEKDSVYVELTEPTELKVTVDSIGPIKCYGDANGFIDITVSGGTLPYTYRWNDGTNDISTKEDLIDKAPGTYTSYVKDRNNCTAQIAATQITQPTKLAADISVTETLKCFGDRDASLQVNPSGGTVNSSYHFQWNDPARQTKQVADGLYPGIYTVKVTDDNGCATLVQKTVTQPAAIKITYNPQTVRCYGGSDGAILLTPSGGTVGSDYSYIWSNSATTKNIIGISSGTYKVTVIDDNQCKDSMDISVDQAPELVLNEIVANHINNKCFGENKGKIELSAIGGYTSIFGSGQYEYSINDKVNYTDASAFINLASGKYKLRVRDKQVPSCVAESLDSIAITPDKINVSANKKDLSCYGLKDGQISGISVTPAGTYTYSLDKLQYKSETTYSGLTAGEYKVFVKNVDDCLDSSLTFTIVEPQNINFDLASSKDSTASTGPNSLYIEAKGGTGSLQYSIDGGKNFTTDPKFTSIDSQGQYLAVVKDENGCQHSIPSDELQQLLSIALSSDVDIQPENRIVIYPNPSDGNVFFRGDYQKIESIKIYSQLGILVKELKSNNKPSANLKDLQPGIYIVYFLPKGIAEPIRLIINK